MRISAWLRCLHAAREIGWPSQEDIDLLLYGHQLAQDPELTLPHPRLRLRRFYLAPLADIAAEVRIPPDGATVGELLEALGASPSVERIGWSAPAPALTGA